MGACAGASATDAGRFETGARRAQGARDATRTAKVFVNIKRLGDLAATYELNVPHDDPAATTERCTGTCSTSSTSTACRS